MCEEIIDDCVVLIESNATNGGNPAKRAYAIEGGEDGYVFPHEVANSILEWLQRNGVNAKIVSLDAYNRKLQNYNERVAAAS